MPVKHYTDLIAWQKAMDLVDGIYDVTDSFPRSEVFGLTNQLRRAAVSIPSNIAEGQGRSTTKDFIHFLCIARGSLQELETQVRIAARRRFMNDLKKEQLINATTEIGKIIHGLIKALNA